MSSGRSTDGEGAGRASGADGWRPGPARPVLGTGEIHVWRLRVTSADDDVRSLGAAERERAARYRFEADRRRFTVARTALRRLAGAYLGREPAGLELVADRYGKPALAGAPPPLRFNVSHSGDVVLLAFARDREVGVDVEAHRPLADAESLSPLACTPRELEALAALAPDARPAALFDLWAGKEATLKALGRGLLVSPRAVELAVPWRGACEVTPDAGGGRAAFVVRRLDAGAGYSAAVAHAPGAGGLALLDADAARPGR